ncbi:MAG: hypothetical protein AB7P00_42690, partial [Sandaracinaceae bacterium]
RASESERRERSAHGIQRLGGSPVGDARPPAERRLDRRQRDHPQATREGEPLPARYAERIEDRDAARLPSGTGFW